MYRRKSRVWLVCLLLAVGTALAQVETARLTGTVTDSTGAVTPGAEITITHQQTNRQVVTTTNNEGRYISVPLPLGDYRVEAQLPGFKRAVRGGIRLAVGETAVVNFTMEVGELAEQVEVTAHAPLLTTTEAAQGQVINNQKIVDLPLNGRDYLQLALLSAGTVQPIGGRFAGFSSDGQRTTQNNYLIDGMDNNNMQIAAQANRAEVVKPSVDAIQEFKVVTNTYSAEFGRAAGGVVNLTIKSGSNNFHGTVFEFLRNEHLDARNFFDRPGTSKPPFKRNQFGFSFGGPILRDKTFFFGDYEGTRKRESRTVNNTVPTLAMRAGDFSAVSTPIFNPATFELATGTRQPFPNNRIPAALIDPVAQKLASFYPTPQNDRLSQNFLFNPPASENLDKFDIRADHIFRSKDNIYYRFSYQTTDVPPSPDAPGLATGGGLNSVRFAHKGWNTGLVWNHVFSPHLISSSRVAWNRIFTDQESPIERNLNAEVGLNGIDQSLKGIGTFNISGFTTLGIFTFTPNLADSQNRQLVNDTTWIRGNHSLKFGANVQRLQQYLANPQRALGNFSFRGDFTRNPRGNVGGNSFADFLLGIPAQTQIDTPVRWNGRSWLHQFYAQDEWLVSRKLTLNLGLRYELFLPWEDLRDGIANFDVDTDPNNPRLVLAKGGSRLDRALIATDRNNFAPRFGFAYQVRSGTVLRGGYGIFIASPEPFGGGEFLETNPPFTLKVDIQTDGINPIVLLREGIPPGTLTARNVPSLALSSYERRPKLPFSQQWNFNLQQQLGKDWLFEIGYYGAKSNHLLRRVNTNYARPGPGNINQRRRYRSLVFPGTDVVVPLGNLNNRHQFDGSSLYHSLQARIEKRFSGGFSLLGSWIWSKTIGDTCGSASTGNTIGCGVQDPLNLRAERSLDNQHLKYRFVLTPMWDLPLGRHQRWGRNWNRGTDALLGGWSAAGIITVTSGQPFTITVRGDPANTGDTNRPNVAGNPHLSGSARTLSRYFNTDAFAANARFAFGNAGRNILTGPGLGNVDFSAYKWFQPTESVTLQFRFEAFNFFNHPNFDFPGTVLGNPTFGQITSALLPRKLQFGLKLIF